MKSKVITTQYEGKDVIYDTGTQTWTYMGIGETAVKALSEEKYATITKLLTKEVEAYKDRIAQEEVDRKAAEDAKAKTELDLWQSKLDAVTPPKGYKLAATRLHDGYLEGNGERVIIEYSTQVYHEERGFNYTTTELKWKVIGNPNRRFKTLEQAVVHAVKTIEARVQKVHNEKAAADLMTEMVNGTIAALKADGLEGTHKTDWHRDEWHHGKSYETHRITVEHGKLTANADMTNDKDVRLIVTKLDVKLTPAQFKLLADFIRDM